MTLRRERWSLTANPGCPFCGGILKLKPLNWKSDEMLKKPDLRDDFYICYRCQKYWPRQAAIMKETARDGTKPKPKRGL